MALTLEEARTVQRALQRRYSRDQRVLHIHVTYSRQFGYNVRVDGMRDMLRPADLEKKVGTVFIRWLPNGAPPQRFTPQYDSYLAESIVLEELVIPSAPCGVPTQQLLPWRGGRRRRRRA